MLAYALRRRGVALTVAGLAAALATSPGTALAAGDDGGGLFGRIFRFGGSSSSSPNKPDPAPSRGRPAGQPPSSLPYGSVFDPSPARNGGSADATPPRVASAFGDSAPGANGSSRSGTSAAGPLNMAGPSTPEVADGGTAPPIAPRSRVSSATTSAEPLVIRTALGRSNDGSQFGMFLQIYADGTVIDSEGVHRLSPSDVKPIADLVNTGELGRNRGHCGSPSTDFIEDVQVVVFERRLGRLTAQPFSYSGNPQGCDPSVRQFHQAVESLQAKLSGQSAPIAHAAEPASPAMIGAVSPPPSMAAPSLSGMPNAVGRTPALPATSIPLNGPVIPLTSPDPR